MFQTKRRRRKNERTTSIRLKEINHEREIPTAENILFLINFFEKPKIIYIKALMNEILCVIERYRTAV